jgi:hypothetical protein
MACNNCPGASAPRCWNRAPNGGGDDVGKRLAVAQQHVEARAQPLDQIGFEKQRPVSGRGGDKFHRCRRRNHRSIRVLGRLRYTDPLDILRLADVGTAGRMEHAIRRRRRRDLAWRSSVAGRP